MSNWQVDNHLAFYQSVSLKNFRGFKKSKPIPLSPLTFLVGPNSSGKSSLFDALLLISQCNFSIFSHGVQKPQWAGPLVDLGSYVDTVYKHKASLPLEIGFEVVAPDYLRSTSSKSKTSHMRLIFELCTTAGNPIGRLSRISITDVQSSETLTISYSQNASTLELLGQRFTQQYRDIQQRQKDFFHRDPFHSGSIMALIQRAQNEAGDQLKGKMSAWKRIYSTLYYKQWDIFDEVERVSSGRSAPRRWYSIAELAGIPNEFPFGTRVFSNIDPGMLTEKHDNFSYNYYFKGRKKNLEFNLATALKRLNIASEIIPSELSPYHSSIQVKDNITDVYSNLIDVGYGASQVIPVLRACMSPASGPLFVEQPEIHLHPRAQSTLADILCETSLNRQVIVETHSVHMINKARVLVAEGKLKPEHVSIVFINRTQTGSHTHAIPIREDGEFAEEWPKEFGFFDERYHDTLALLKLKTSSTEKKSASSN